MQKRLIHKKFIARALGALHFALRFCGALFLSPGLCAVLFLALCSMLLAACSSAHAQQWMKVPRVGFLNPSYASAMSARVEVFRQGLRELGYVEGKTIIIDYRFA